VIALALPAVHTNTPASWQTTVDDALQMPEECACVPDLPLRGESQLKDSQLAVSPCATNGVKWPITTLRPKGRDPPAPFVADDEDLLQARTTA